MRGPYWRRVSIGARRRPSHHAGAGMKRRATRVVDMDTSVQWVLLPGPMEEIR
jgi:hypothetical protein